MKRVQGNRVGVTSTVLVLLAGLSLGACSKTTTTKPEATDPAYGGGGTIEISDPSRVGLLKDTWGVEILGIHPTAAGYMLDFRYRVVDAQKAAPLLDRHIKPYIIVEKDNSKLAVPVSAKLGPLRQTTKNVRENRNYFVFFTNPSRHVRSGDKVTVVIGDFELKHLSVL